MSTNSAPKPTVAGSVATPLVEGGTGTTAKKASAGPNTAHNSSATTVNTGSTASYISSPNPSAGQASDKQTNPNDLSKDNSEGVWARMKAFAEKHPFVIGGLGLVCGAALARGAGGVTLLPLIPIAEPNTPTKNLPSVVTPISALQNSIPPAATHKLDGLPMIPSAQPTTVQKPDTTRSM